MDWFLTTLQRKIRHILRTLVSILRPNCKDNFGCFELFGCDVLVDSDLKVWLIEVNSEPSLNRGTNLKRILVPSIVSEALALTLECYAKQVDDEPIFPLTAQRTFQILVNETKSRPNYSYHQVCKRRKLRKLPALSAATLSDINVRAIAPEADQEMQPECAKTKKSKVRGRPGEVEYSSPIKGDSSSSLKGAHSEPEKPEMRLLCNPEHTLMKKSWFLSCLKT